MLTAFVEKLERAGRQKKRRSFGHRARPGGKCFGRRDGAVEFCLLLGILVDFARGCKARHRESMSGTVRGL